jgi:crotonobetainyl-CoA:carnitine CoA-transferase CaiB-like acyl-CoA transferase
MAADYFATHKVPYRMGSAHPTIVPYQCFEARDGEYLTLAVGNDSIWRSFCNAIRLEELVENPKFATNPKRVENRNELVSMLVRIFLTKDRDDWLRLLSSERVPCGPVYDIDEVFLDAQILHRKMCFEVEHPKAGKISQIGVPMKFSAQSGVGMVAPPLLGQHTEEILKDLGYSEQEIKHLKEENVI